MTLEYLDTIFIASQAVVNPALTTQLIFSNAVGSGTSVVELGHSLISPASLFSSTGNFLSIFLNEVWNWILFNLLSPIIMIVGLILFIALQVALIYVYYLLVKEVVLRIINLWSTVSGNDTFKNLKQKVNSIIN